MLQLSMKKGKRDKGKMGELIASWYLRLKGYRILRRRWHYRNMGEVDIVATRGNVLCFVEVKYRHDESNLPFAVTPYQQRRIMRTAAIFMQRHQELTRGKLIRFDIVLVAPWKFPYHLTEQWNWSDLEW